MISQLNLPLNGFARVAQDRYTYNNGGEGSDEDYSQYLQNFNDQQELAKRVMGFGYNYNYLQHRKDSGYVNRGDFIVSGGGKGVEKGYMDEHQTQLFRTQREQLSDLESKVTSMRNRLGKLGRVGRHGLSVFKLDGMNYGDLKYVIKNARDAKDYIDNIDRSKLDKKQLANYDNLLSEFNELATITENVYRNSQEAKFDNDQVYAPQNSFKAPVTNYTMLTNAIDLNEVYPAGHVHALDNKGVEMRKYVRQPKKKDKDSVGLNVPNNTNNIGKVATQAAAANIADGAHAAASAAKNAVDANFDANEAGLVGTHLNLMGNLGTDGYKALMTGMNVDLGTQIKMVQANAQHELNLRKLENAEEEQAFKDNIVTSDQNMKKDMHDQKILDMTAKRTQEATLNTIKNAQLKQQMDWDNAQRTRQILINLRDDAEHNEDRNFLKQKRAAELATLTYNTNRQAIKDTRDDLEYAANAEFNKKTKEAQLASITLKNNIAQHQYDKMLADEKDKDLIAYNKAKRDAEIKKWQNEQADRELKIKLESQKRLTDQLDYFAKQARENKNDNFWSQRGDGDLFNTLDKAGRWDPLTNPINKNINKRMENRLQQTIPPYDLPKNYPIYGGSYNGMPMNMNSMPYTMYARQGRTGRRTNMEKFGVPSVRMYQKMKKMGAPMPGASMPMQTQQISATPQDYYEPQAYTGYSDGDEGYMNSVNRIAKGMLFGPTRQVTTANQVVSSYLPNMDPSFSRAMYLGANAIQGLTPQIATNAEKMQALSDRIKLQQLIGDDKIDAASKEQLTQMANMYNPGNESGWKKGIAAAGTVGALALRGLGTVAENFWPMHDAYHRYKTMSTIGRAVGKAGDTIFRMFPTGYGYKKRKKGGKKRSKLRYGGMIIPPKNLKKMFENKSCKCKN